jgi:hypothetical protein
MTTGLNPGGSIWGAGCTFKAHLHGVFGFHLYLYQELDEPDEAYFR